MRENIPPLDRLERALLVAGCWRDTRTNGRERRWTCPAHEDRNPSLDVREGEDRRVLFTCRAGCPQDAVLVALRLEKRELFPSGSRGSEPQPGGQDRKSADLSDSRGEKWGGSEPQGLTPEQYATAKHLDLDVLRTFGVREVTYFGPRALELPYYDANGEPAATRYRLRLEKGSEGDARFRWKRGTKPLLYGLWRLDRAREAGYVVLVEGESDCHTLWSHDVPALGIPGDVPKSADLKG